MFIHVLAIIQLHITFLTSGPSCPSDGLFSATQFYLKGTCKQSLINTKFSTSKHTHTHQREILGGARVLMEMLQNGPCF